MMLTKKNLENYLFFGYSNRFVGRHSKVDFCGRFLYSHNQAIKMIEVLPAGRRSAHCPNSPETSMLEDNQSNCGIGVLFHS